MNFRRRPPAENWQSEQEEDFWIYLPDDVFPEISPLNYGGRGRTSLLDREWMRRSSYAFPSIPPAPPRPYPVRLLLIDAYPGARSSTPPPPASYEWSRDNESRLSQEDQKQAISKLRKQLYSPHISNIIRRLGGGATSSQDDDGKTCAVCQDDFETKQFVTVTPCNHMFHEECIVPWVKSQGTCPVCRFAIADNHRRSGTTTATARRSGRIHQLS
ncbi:uncharacterized protein LOC127240295 [Andrographis paniculata]|uniref:uncharacterized protein LOC127240295 n=1 Tax=Andrographis paniculata TaxID=175694 RepID=UPI0021E7B1E1|nr:uncharacterized protein LOC127240295 [Andrographis paniculata]XP_051114832.1 uncharacterized protein LOC127240295 [Andrographis paniculata]